MNRKLIFCGLPGVVLLFSCQKVVTLNLDTVPPQLVIQGEVTDQPGPYTVNISRSVDFYADNAFPAVSGAIVHISDGQGVTDSLVETSPGNYVTQALAGRPGNTYTLSVSVDGTSYTAVSVMPFPVPLDSVTLEHTKGRFGRKDQITPQADYQDP